MTSAPVLKWSDAEPNRRPDSTGIKLVQHPRFKKGLEALSLFLKNGIDPRNGEARCFVIHGEGRCGKTALASFATEMVEAKPLPIRRGDPDLPRKRWLWVEMPKQATEKSVAEAILGAIKDPIRNAKTSSQLVSRAASQLASMDVELVIFDEVHHILQNTTKDARLVAEFFKSFLNYGICPLIMVGMNPINCIVDESPQLDGRTWGTHEMPLFSFDEPKDQRQFGRLISELAAMRSIPLAPELSAPSFWEAMHRATGGAVGLVALYLDKAEALAIDAEMHHLTKELFVQAFSSKKRAERNGRPVINPFSVI